ncbi:MAG: dihydroorotate dehydrogenase electron transfer subunit, partial [Gammaproteobacteria bacterium]|nr:dihydroorotate dehydrogenase electron transfer subunit [Gammaproteobacteria bacterium]
MRNKKNRMVFIEEAEVLAQKAYEGAQCILRLHAPLTATHAQPGNFAHIRCDEDLPLRRPLSIMGTDPVAGWVDFLYKVVGDGTTRLSHRRPGDHLNLMGPIGTPFTPHTERPRTLLVGGGVGLPPMVFLAGELREQERFKPLVILGSEVPFPFRPSPSRIMVPGMPSDVIAAMP